MKYLLDTHMLLCAATEPDRLPFRAGKIVRDRDSSLFFSAASIWEVAIKSAKGSASFKIDPGDLRASLYGVGLSEISVLSEHAIVTAALPLLHKDPFDRILIAQALHEGLTLLTVDRIIARYPDPILCV